MSIAALKGWIFGKEAKPEPRNRTPFHHIVANERRYVEGQFPKALANSLQIANYESNGIPPWEVVAAYVIFLEERVKELESK